MSRTVDGCAVCRRKNLTFYSNHKSESLLKKSGEIRKVKAPASQGKSAIIVMSVAAAVALGFQCYTQYVKSAGSHQHVAARPSSVVR
jgi:hypothetical protein